MAASTTSLLECRLLGPLDIEVGGRRLQMTAPRLQSVLGTLLLRAGETVPVQRLVDCVWEGRPPADPSNQIAVCVSLLRRKLVQAGAAGDLIVTEAPGYRLQTHAVRLDTRRVTQLGKEAAERRAAGEHEAAVGLLGEALSLWRGPLLAGVSRQVWQSDVHAWEEKRVALRDMCTKIQLELGQYEHLISELSSFIQEHPLFERPRAQLMTALYHSGRQADALRVFRETSELLKAELAVAPGAELRQLHHDILHGTLPPVRRVATWQDGPAPRRRAAAPTTPFRASTPSTPGILSIPDAPVTSTAPVTPDDPVTPGASVAQTAPGAAAAPVRATEVSIVPTASAPPTGPCLLPGDIGEFVGREAEIAAIQDILAPGTGPVPVVGVVGAGGTGKSTLAVHVAHRLRPAFTGGQLYIDLRGTAARPVSPAEALARLLRELGVPASSIPAEVEERAERYRALLADRRVLIVLDNAAGTEQIRPLLPGTGSCGVLITGRARVGVVSTANVFELGMFSEEQAVQLLGRIAGAGRTQAEPEAARELVGHCGRLPLAVGIVGAKLAAKPHWSLARVAVRLADERQRLDELTHDKLAVRASLRSSYEGIGPAARRLLHGLALSDFGEWVAAPVLGLPAARAESLLEELVDARLIEVMDTGRVAQLRYRMHSLVRLYAMEQEAATAPGAAVEQDRANGIGVGFGTSGAGVAMGAMGPVPGTPVGAGDFAAELRTVAGAVARGPVTSVVHTHHAVRGGEFGAVRGGSDLPRGTELAAVANGVPALRRYEAERARPIAPSVLSADCGVDACAADLAAACRCLVSARGHHDHGD
ncbi:AfsR/SARP family transcriptional regulator [Streptomyces noursei]|uniref:AfsR/SARP family transcriptional regulator n=1 Tax=Streptomyces noursei TaxID=1971 RepID=UPI000C9C1A9A|nr:AfsR/SARP family transcriptional regulator [Streptomyces noursei]